MFVLWSALIGYVFSEKWKPPLIHSIEVLLLAVSMLWVCFNATTPLFGKNSVLTTNRTDQYFAVWRNWPGIKTECYVETAKYISDNKIRNVGMLLEEADWEYPLWMLSKEWSDEGIRFEHVQVTDNISRNIPLAPFEPDVLVCSTAWIEDHQERYRGMVKRYGEPRRMPETEEDLEKERSFVIFDLRESYS